MKCEWEKCKLGDVCNISSSKRIFAKEYTKAGIPFYRGKEIIEKSLGNNVSTELFISQKRYEEIKSKFDVPQKGDILLTSVGTLGVPWLVNEDDFYFKDGNLTWLRTKNELLNTFLYLWLNSSEAKHQIDTMCIGSTQRALTIDTLRKFEISVPSIQTQEKICSILYPIMDKIELNNAINNNLEQQAKAIFKSWFIDFEPFGETMPSNWRIGTVGEIIELHDSKRIPLSGAQRANMDKLYPYYGATSLMDYVDGYLFDGVYLLLGEDGTVVDDKGFPILQYIDGKFWVNNHAHILTGKLGFSVEELYLLFSLTNIKSIVTGAVQQKVSQQNLKKVPAIIPSGDTLSSFDELIQPIFSQIRNLRDENARLITLRDTLLPRLMSGELDVFNIEF